MSVSIVLPATTESILLLVVPCRYSDWLTNLLNPGALVASKPNDFLVLLPCHISSATDPLSVPAPNILTWLVGLSLPGQVAVLTCPAGLLWVGLSCLVFYCPESAACVARRASHYVQWSLLGQGGVCFSVSCWFYILIPLMLIGHLSCFPLRGVYCGFQWWFHAFLSLIPVGHLSLGGVWYICM